MKMKIMALALLALAAVPAATAQNYNFVFDQSDFLWCYPDSVASTGVIKIVPGADEPTEVKVYLHRTEENAPYGTNFRNIQFNLTFPEGIRPVPLEEDVLWVVSGDDVCGKNSPYVTFDYNLDDESLYPNYTLVGMNMNQKNITANPAWVCFFYVKADADIDPDTPVSLMWDGLKYTTSTSEQIRNLDGGVLAVFDMSDDCDLFGDVTGDCVVDIADLNLIINEILAGTSNNDLNGDGTVDVADLNIIINIILGIDPDPDPGLWYDPDLCPDGHHPHWIDLGLPSGTLWACCNVGATDPTGYGDYFSWGETEPKEDYSWETYKWCMGSYDTLTKYCTHPDDGFEGFCDSKMWLDLEDDAAYVNWDKRGRMPSLVQIQELLDSCDSEWVERNGVRGRVFTSRLNGASLFFPAAGYRNGASPQFVGSDGDYWSRTLNDLDAPDCAYSLSFYSENAYWNWGWERSGGHSVRAVRVGQPAPPPAGGTTYTVNGVSFNMISVAGGTFTMGATAEQGSDASDWEKPTHEVTLSDFAIGQTEVTQALWQAVMGSNPSWFKGESLPVENVSWEDCQTFITKLNELTGKTFRLPTEAEWEYAARGGSKSVGFKYAGGDDIDEVAWYDSNSDHTTQPVATKAPNELGLYDMSGNVWELCSDWYNDYSSAAVTNPTGPASGSYCMIRGGSWFDDAWSCRVSNRGDCVSTYRGRYIGFRLVLGAMPDPDPDPGLCPDGHHPHWIDLGLPSGTLWACCNVGASVPTGYGDYFAWGETEPKEDYSWTITSGATVTIH